MIKGFPISFQEPGVQIPKAIHTTNDDRLFELWQVTREPKISKKPRGKKQE